MRRASAVKFHNSSQEGFLFEYIFEIADHIPSERRLSGTERLRRMLKAASEHTV
jgi:hypothetical protein